MYTRLPLRRFIVILPSVLIHRLGPVTRVVDNRQLCPQHPKLVVMDYPDSSAGLVMWFYTPHACFNRGDTPLLVVYGS
jgi:hypothetical protein